jgi:hypothetical protein
MLDAFSVKPLLKRGALIAAANWQVVLLQFIAESAFKLLLIVPVVGAACLGALLAGANVLDLASRDVRQILALLVSALGAHPGALACYLAGALVLLVGGAAVTFLAKGGSVAVLVRAERHAPAVERPPLRLAVFRRAEAFRIERFSTWSQRLFRRYFVLGLGLMAAYGALGVIYLVSVYTAYQVVADTGLVLAWTLLASLLSVGLVLSGTVVNLLYLLTQIAIAADDCGVGAAMRAVTRFLAREYRTVAILFAALLTIVGLATIASILATTSLGVIGFVPIVGLAVVPLQLIAWLARAVLFQYLGLTALCAYVRLYRVDQQSALVATSAPVSA